MKPVLRWSIPIIVSLGCLVHAEPGFGQESPDSTVGSRYAKAEVKLPHLGEHVFSPNRYVPGPFITTFVQNSLGLGEARDIETPILIIDGKEILALKGSLLFAFLDFAYQQRIKSWIAARARLRVTGRLGTDVQAFLSDGVTTVTAYEFGWLIKLLKTDRIMLSGDLMLSNRTFTLLNVFGLVEDIIAGQPLSLTSTTPTLRAGGGLRFAWAGSELLGVTALLDLGIGESVNRNERDKLYFSGGAVMDVDLHAKTPAPVGLALGYRFDSYPEAGDYQSHAAHGVLLRISYTGRPDFSLGFELSAERINAGKLRGPFTLGSTLIDFRYFF